MTFFHSIQSFFNSIGEYVKNFSYLFLIFVGAFVLLSLVVIVITSFAYETMLTKTIDKINRFLEHNPRINDDNLVAFNNLMKASSVPKALRRQWQQFMLYREHPASYYMSFQHCVENPLRNSAYKQQMVVYKILSYILVALSLVVSSFMAVQSVYPSLVLQDIIIIPMTILVGYWLVSMVLNLVHNATSSDLFQNYQYFEINMDKAMLTLPEFVDYEVLFSQDEIKRGIPVLFAYLQKRAVQEQQELEKARLKTVNHEKFDFDEAGLDGSLVLDRAMRETENFASQRKKYMQEIERVNNEITALENNYKEQVKDYQRQVQTSKETVDNLKEQLEQATSTIEINYIKKQIRDEINRQQLSEKEFDTTTDKYNQGIKSLNQEIKHYDDETKKAKEALESAMLSEFGTYSVKVYNNLEKIVDEKMQDRVDDFKEQIKGLEGKLEEKNEELENVYARYQEVLAEQPAEEFEAPAPVEVPKKEKKGKKKKGDPQGGLELANPAYEQPQEEYMQNEGEYPAEDYQEQYDNYSADGQYYADGNYDGYDNAQYTDENYDNAQYDNQYYDQNEYDNTQYDANLDYGDEQTEYANNGETEMADDSLSGGYYQEGEMPSDNSYIPLDDNSQDTYIPLDDGASYDAAYVPLDDVDSEQDGSVYVPLDEEPAEITANTDNEQPSQGVDDQEFVYVPLDEENKVEEKPKKKNRKKDTDSEGESHELTEVASEPISTNEVAQPVEEYQNEQAENAQPASEADDEFGGFDSSIFDFDFTDTRSQKSTEQPVEQMAENEAEQPAEEPTPSEPTVDEDFDLEQEEPAISSPSDLDLSAIANGNIGEQDELPAPTMVRRVGRPRKEVPIEDIKPKRSVGRPRKIVEEEEKPRRSVGRPRKEANNTVARKVGRPRKEEPAEEKRSVGRPKKVVKRSVGRPKKEIVEAEKPKRSVGRPKKEQTVEKTVRSVGRPRKEQTAEKPTRSVGRPKKTETTEVKRPVGRPKKPRRGRPKKNG